MMWQDINQLVYDNKAMVFKDEEIDNVTSEMKKKIDDQNTQIAELTEKNKQLTK